MTLVLYANGRVCPLLAHAKDEVGEHRRER